MTTARDGKPVIPAHLYHYTCADHGVVGIRRSGMLKPAKQPLLGRKLVWFTDLTPPDRWALGLTNIMLCCDRTEYRVTVTTAATFIVPWWYYARSLFRLQREILEQDGLPMHWWVSRAPVSAGDIVATTELHAQATARKAAP